MYPLYPHTYMVLFRITQMHTYELLNRSLRTVFRIWYFYYIFSAQPYVTYVIRASNIYLLLHFRSSNLEFLVSLSITCKTKFNPPINDLPLLPLRSYSSFTLVAISAPLDKQLPIVAMT